MHAPYRRVAIIRMADDSADDSGGVQMRLLGSSRDLDGGELPDLYGYPADHNGVWLRANFIASLDGGATFSGKSGQLGGPGDRAVFAALREIADVILVGAGTVRAEGYAGARPTVAQRQRRQAAGRAKSRRWRSSPDPATWSGICRCSPAPRCRRWSAPARRQPTRPDAH